MKMLKKMAALLLAGVMALALLTACGDDSAPSFAQKTEDAAFGAMKQATGIQVNDARFAGWNGKCIWCVCQNYENWCCS